MKLLSLVFWCLIASTTSGEAKKRKHYTSSSYLDSYQFPDQPSNPNHYQPNNNNNGGYGHGGGGYLEAEEESSGESYSDFMDRYYHGSNSYQMPSLGGRFDLEEGSGEVFFFLHEA